LTSLDGEKYVDFLGEYTAGIYGHSNPAIAAAVYEAMKNGWNYGGPNNYERELAKKVNISYVF
jgi:glutamate-1-semialdehyde 2,1-aminomutase